MVVFISAKGNVMRFYAVVTLVAVLLGHPAFAAGGAAALDSEKQRFSYALGIQIGQSLKQDGLDVDVDALNQAISDVITGQEPRLSMEEMQTAVQQFQQRMQSERMAVGERNREAGEAFLEENRADPEVVETDSGLQYRVIEEGSGQSPTADDTVKVHYRGTLIDGTEFDSSLARGEPVEFPVGNVIEGWQEVLPMMKEGAKWKVYVPAELAYGERGAGSDIGPNATLIFDIELLEVKE